MARRELPVPLDNDLVARVPYPMTEEDFLLLIDTLQLWKKAAGASEPLKCVPIESAASLLFFSCHPERERVSERESKDLADMVHT